MISRILIFASAQKSRMNLAHEEKILIKDIFNVRVSREAGYAKG